MSNFFERELGWVFGDGQVIRDPTYSGRACLGTLGKDLRVRAQFITSGYADHYDALKITVLNRTDGPVDTLVLKLKDLLGMKPVPGNPYFPNGVAPHIWLDQGKPEWYAFQPTAADYDTAREALACGASQLTHMYNAMMPFSHRAPGPIGAAADDSRCMVELICDGVHVHPSVVRATFHIFGDDRIVMISDSMRAAGLEDGRYDLGGQSVLVRGNLAILEDGTIAGSVTNLMDCVRTAVHDMGIPFASAVKCAAVNPAKAVGIYDAYGSLTPGKFANIVILDKNLDIKTVLHHGI